MVRNAGGPLTPQDEMYSAVVDDDDAEGCTTKAVDVAVVARNKNPILIFVC
jgi:hypothetical protein